MVSATPKCRYRRRPHREVERSVLRGIRSLVRSNDRRGRQCRRAGKPTSWPTRVRPVPERIPPSGFRIGWAACECAGSSMRTDTKVSAILSSDRSEVGDLVSLASRRSAMKYLDRLGHAAMFRSGIIVFALIVALAFSATFARSGRVRTRADLGELSRDARICLPALHVAA